MAPQYTMHVTQTVRITAGENVSTVAWANDKNKQKIIKRTKPHADRHNDL